MKSKYPKWEGLIFSKILKQIIYISLRDMYQEYKQQIIHVFIMSYSDQNNLYLLKL